MADYKLVGKNFTPPDLIAKVTGNAKYAEDFQAEGMLHAKMVLSPMPHARVRNIDTSAALQIKGVVAIITPEDVPQFPPPTCRCCARARAASATATASRAACLRRGSLRNIWRCR